MTKLRHPDSGVIVEVTPEKAELLGWPEAEIEAEPEAEPKRPARKR